MKERLIPVENWADLGAGMIIVMKPCKVCKGPHRGMLTSRNTFLRRLYLRLFRNTALPRRLSL